jgi:sugar phosphate permease
LTYAILHATREGWAFMKDSISEEEKPGIGISDGELGIIDSSFYIMYGFCLLISGNLGDKYSIRLLMGIGFLLTAGVHVLIGFGGIWQI